MVLHVAVEQLGRDRALDHFGLDGGVQLVVRDRLGVLRRDDDRADANGASIFVQHGDLCLAIRAQPRQRAGLAALGERLREAMRELNRHRHELGRLVRRVAEHHPLVARAARVHALRDVRRLAIDRAQHSARLAIEAEARVVVADGRDRAANDVRDGHVRVRRDLASHAREAGGDERFARDARIGIRREDRIEHGVGDLIRDLVWVTFGHRFGCKNEAVHWGRRGCARRSAEAVRTCLRAEAIELHFTRFT